MTSHYMPGERFGLLATHITSILRARRRAIHRPGMGTRDDLHTSIHTALRGHGVPMGEPFLNRETGRVDPTDRLALVEALTDLPVSAFTGDFDVSDVRLALGEHGEVWPASVREDTEVA
ncbi:MAG: hypothetical protein KL801_12585 [Mesorhizobium sp.]|nr:hypothetical protein [Mesorhizobium sp.]